METGYAIYAITTTIHFEKFVSVALYKGNRCSALPLKPCFPGGSKPIQHDSTPLSMIAEIQQQSKNFPQKLFLMLDCEE